ncbi:glycosyltransferase family 2 protein [Olleya aquimaris]|uniref:Glycosyltransferase involved in cell wall biosynthesis n=1 Tax=Olleya aquimaris TaxID=639310 RepID=A0A327RD61_9FLAO|nr:glycosyltransferase family 2 protein [Olleya aquimaris]RAJ13403.1 glycosyltransferase involved in cell wall biosynthesis [Olleya aquimaris]
MSCFFSVAIPVYNKEKYILNTLTSVLNQSFQDFEIILVDDGSTDDSLKIIESLEDQRITLIKQKNQGASVARNNAIMAAKGKYIATLDADDLWESNHLQALKECIESIDNAVLYCTNYRIKRTNGFITNAKFNFEYGNTCQLVEDFFEANIINYIPHSSSVAFKKEDFLSIGGYNPKYRTGQDIDLWIKFALYGNIAFNPKITMLYNFYDEDSLSNSNLNTDRKLLITSFKKAETNHPSLKRYLDIKRYALAIRYRFLNEEDKANELIKDINPNHLNKKQRLLLKCPRFILITMKKLQQFLLKNNIYLSAFR